MLQECEASVAAQTEDRWEHIIEVDKTHKGCAVTMNRLARRAKASAEWLLPLADDDLLLPGALRELLSHADGGDIVYSPPLVWGRNPDGFLKSPPEIPSFALIRRDLWFELGGYNEELRREEDRRMWTDALNGGARFVRVDSQPTWVYRHHAGNKSFNNGEAS